MPKWRKDEIKIVEDNLFTSINDLRNLLPNHSEVAIESYRRKNVRKNLGVTQADKKNFKHGETPINLSIITDSKITEKTRFAKLRTVGVPIDISIKYDGPQVVLNRPNENNEGDNVGLFIAADWHIGHNYDNGEYTLTNRRKGLSNSVRNVIHVIRHHNRVKKLAIAVLGDTMQGLENYEHQASESQPESIQIKDAIQALKDYLVPLIDTCNDEGIDFEIVEITGSHGRTTKKWDKYIDNHDSTIYWVVTEFLKLMYGEEIEKKIFMDKKTVIREYDGVVVAFEHGDACYSIKGMPFYGLLARIKDLTYMHNVKKRINCLITGHYHCWGRFNVGGCHFITTGTLQTESNLGFALGRSAVTDFHFVGIHKGRLRASYPIFTDISE